MAGFVGLLLETLLSALVAPAMMLIQSQAIASILMGRDVGWQVQRRDDGSLSWGETATRYAGQTIFGAILGMSAYVVSLPLFLWMSPVIIGLLTTVPLGVLTSNARIGRAFARFRLFATPEERIPPLIVRRAIELSAAPAEERTHAFDMLQRSAALSAAHRQMIGAKPERCRGSVNEALVVGCVKLDDAHTVCEAIDYLTPREVMAILSDEQGFEKLTRLFRIGQPG